MVQGERGLRIIHVKGKDVSQPQRRTLLIAHVKTLPLIFWCQSTGKRTFLFSVWKWTFPVSGCSISIWHLSKKDFLLSLADRSNCSFLTNTFRHGLIGWCFLQIITLETHTRMWRLWTTRWCHLLSRVSINGNSLMGQCHNMGCLVRSVGRLLATPNRYVRRFRTFHLPRSRSCIQLRYIPQIIWDGKKEKSVILSACIACVAIVKNYSLEYHILRESTTCHYTEEPLRNKDSLNVKTCASPELYVFLEWPVNRPVYFDINQNVTKCCAIEKKIIRL